MHCAPRQQLFYQLRALERLFDFMMREFAKKMPSVEALRSLLLLGSRAADAEDEGKS